MINLTSDMETHVIYVEKCIKEQSKIATTDVILLFYLFQNFKNICNTFNLIECLAFQFDNQN